jgi:hypothetical protein
LLPVPSFERIHFLQIGILLATSVHFLLLCNLFLTRRTFYSRTRIHSMTRLTTEKAIAALASRTFGTHMTYFATRVTGVSETSHHFLTTRRTLGSPMIGTVAVKAPALHRITRIRTLATPVAWLPAHKAIAPFASRTGGTDMARRTARKAHAFAAFSSCNVLAFCPL